MDPNDICPRCGTNLTARYLGLDLLDVVIGGIADYVRRLTPAQIQGLPRWNKDDARAPCCKRPLGACDCPDPTFCPVCGSLIPGGKP